MQVEEKAALLRIFIGENDRFGQRPLYEAIVLKGAGAGACRGDCADRWALAIRVACIPLKFCVSPKIFLSLSKSSTASKISRPFSRCWRRW